MSTLVTHLAGACLSAALIAAGTAGSATSASAQEVQVQIGFDGPRYDDKTTTVVGRITAVTVTATVMGTIDRIMAAGVRGNAGRISRHRSMSSRRASTRQFATMTSIRTPISPSVSGSVAATDRAARQLTGRRSVGIAVLEMASWCQIRSLAGKCDRVRL